MCCKQLSVYLLTPIMPCKVLLVSLVLVAVLVKVLHASAACASAPGGSCQPMSISKALSSPGSGQQLQSSGPYISENIRAIQDPLLCTSLTDSLPEVRNLSVSLFPHKFGYYGLLLQWNTDGNSSGYNIQVLGSVASDPHSRDREHYKTRVTDPTVTSVLLERVSYYPFPGEVYALSIRVQPISRSESDCVSLTDIRVSSQCEAFVFNQQCSQAMVHTPLDTTLFQIQTTLLSDEGQDLPLVSMRLSWERDDADGDGIMIALTADGEGTDCNLSGRNPPCFLVSNTTSVTISPLNVSAQYKATLYKFDQSQCLPNLAHLFNGCGRDYCCRDYSPIPFSPPTNATPSTRDAGTLSPAPHSTAPPGTSDHAESENSRRLLGELSPDKPSGLQAVAIAVPLVLFVVALFVVIVALSLYKLSRKSKKPLSPDCHVTNTPPSVVTVTSDTTSPNIELASFSSESSSPSVLAQPLSGYWYPPSFPVASSLSPSPSALVLYSPNTPKDEIETILGTVNVGLSRYGIDAKSPDTCVESANISVWLEKEVKNSTVLLVCNESLKKDWESERPSKLVSSLKQLLHGSVVDRGLSNFATVIMSGRGDRAHVPTPYLNAQKQFIVGDSVEDIADISHFVLKVPLYQPSLVL